MPKIEVQPPRGTRDFFPEDMRRREWLHERFRSVAHRFAFEQVDAPVVESAELFIRKAGEEIVDQLYHFELHGRHLALRPEITPSIARMVLARAGGLRLPIRWFSLPQCWRYERMSRGRRREHFQWNMDIWGEPGVSAEAELIAAVCQLLDDLGLAATDIRIRVSSRALLEEALRNGPLRDKPGLFAPLCVVVDKLDKLGRDAVIELLSDPAGSVALDPDTARSVVEMLSARNLDDARGLVPETSAALSELRALFARLADYGIADRVSFDASVVRGLAYYTGIVFEAGDARGELRALCGGGRYDQLLETLGGPSLPAVGFGFGDAVIEELLADRGLLPELPRTLDDVVFAFGPEQRPEAARLAMRLRRQGRAVDLVLGFPRLKRAMADADRAGASQIWLLGPDEVARGVARVRDLGSGEQRDEKLED